MSKDLESNNNLFNDLINSESDINFHSLIDGNRAIDLEERWQQIIDRIFEDVSAYPLMEDWADHDLAKLKSIKTKIDKIISMLDEN